MRYELVAMKTGQTQRLYKWPLSLQTGGDGDKKLMSCGCRLHGQVDAGQYWSHSGIYRALLLTCGNMNNDRTNKYKGYDRTEERETR